MKIIFIVGSVVNPNSIKRIDELAEAGFEVEAYGFKRDVDVKNHPNHCEITVIGQIINTTSYPSRLKTIAKGIKKVIKTHSGQDCLYYLIGLEVAMFFRIFSKEKYIFEEADMVHLSMPNKKIANLFEKIDKHIIRKSYLSAFRSEGFIDFHFGNKVPENVMTIPNKLNKNILKFPVPPSREPDIKNLKFGFTGFIRYKAIFNFAKTLCSNFPQHEFHFYGTFTSDKIKEEYEELNNYPNCFFHGSFRSPDDLPGIYSEIDILLSAYDTINQNVRYLESNKIYESIYFEKPIIVSNNTFLAKKVKNLGIGYDINPFSDADIIGLLESLSLESISQKIKNIQKIPKTNVINKNEELLKRINLLDPIQ